VVEIARLRKAEKFLQKPVNGGRVEKVAATHHVGDALYGIVGYHREVIAGRRLAARQDYVTPEGRVGRHGPRLAQGPVSSLLP
jgi:hypothetical protein